MGVSQSKRIQSLVYSALFCVIIVLCSYICVPTPLPFTLQTFGVYCACFILGGRRALYSVITYISLGAVGIPVFSFFRGGLSTLLGATGGYIWGFVFIPLCCMILSKKSVLSKVTALYTGTILCYITGTLQYTAAYMNATNLQAILTAVTVCVIPYIIPDALKLILAKIVSDRLSHYITLQ